MKKIILLFTLLFTVITSAQYAIVSAVDLKDGMEDQYLALEEFFGPVHDQAIKDGIENSQAVFKVIESNDGRENPAEYFIITGFSSKEQLDAYNKSWEEGKWLAFSKEAYKGKMSSRRVTRYLNSVGSESNERRNYHIEWKSSTIWAGGSFKPGDKMSLTSTIAKSDDFESWESEIIKPMVEKEIIMGLHRWWSLVEIYERAENAYEGITHFFFNVGVPGAERTGWGDMDKTFKGKKLKEGVQSASEHQNSVTLELVSIHN